MTHPDSEFLVSHREWLENILVREIPLGGAMGVTVQRLDGSGIVLAAPLDANINDKGTAFGGSLVSLMILAGWSLLRLQLEYSGTRADLVIARADTRFLAPVDGPMEARCEWAPEAQKARFDRRLAERGRAGLDLHPTLWQDNTLAAELQARYAALAAKPIANSREARRA